MIRRAGPISGTTASVTPARSQDEKGPRKPRPFFLSGMSSRERLPLLAERTNLVLERPRVARLLVELPVGVRDGSWPHQDIGRKTVHGVCAHAFLAPLAHP